MEKKLATRQRVIGDACAQCGWQRKSFASCGGSVSVYTCADCGAHREEHVTRGDAALWGCSVCSCMSWGPVRLCPSVSARQSS